ncbi:PTS sugar transporter subunit IIA [Escherichia coli]|nr:PTS sugar transporter subunit IIA [Escherichia coli]
MLNIWLSDSTIALRKNAATWQQALDICARPLLDAEIITTDYLSAIKTQHEKLGPYYVLAPGLAMPHARPEEGAKGLGLSLLKLEEGVSFHTEEFDPVDVIILLAAPDKHSHWICPYISRHLLSLNPLQARCRRYSRGER